MTDFLCTLLPLGLLHTAVVCHISALFEVKQARYEVEEALTGTLALVSRGDPPLRQKQESRTYSFFGVA